MILIVGCGFLGSYLASHIVSETHETVTATVRSLSNVIPVEGVKYIECDITKTDDLLRLKEHLKNESLTVFYFAACHYIDYIYENPEAAFNVNITALKNFLDTLPNIRKLFFASTDCVYGEKESKADEKSALVPVNEYGRQKILAEEIVHEKGFTVFRYPFMLGKSLTAKPHFFDNICSNLSSGKETEMIDGMYRNVLSYRQAAELTYKLSLIPSLPDTVNICSDSVLSKYDVGIILAKMFNKPTELIKKISEEEGGKFFRDKRASCTFMDNALLRQLTGLEKINWEEETCS